MGFPNVPVLTTFTGADENPLSEGGNWVTATAWWGNALKRVSNHAALSALAFSGSRWVAQFGPELETFVRITTLPPVVNDQVGIGLYTTDPAIDGNPSGYELYIVKVASDFELNLYRLDVGVYTSLLLNVPLTFSAGQHLGLSYVAGTFRLYRGNSGATVWTFISSTADATYVASTFYTLLGLNDATTRLDNFGAGTVSPPANFDISTATVIPALPYANAQNVRVGSITYEVWYQYTAIAGDIELGAWGFGDLAIYRPEIRPFIGPTSVPVSVLGINADNIPIQFPVDVGITYYLRFTPNSASADPAVLNVSVLKGPTELIPAGTICVPDDSTGFPLVCLAPDTGDVLSFFHPFAAGEAGDILEDGTVLMNEFDEGLLKRYDAFTDFALLGTVAINMGIGFALRTLRGASAWYVGIDGTPVTVKRVAQDGTIGATTWTLTGNTTIFAIAASLDESVLYFSNATSGSALKRWDLVNDVALSNLVGPTAGPAYLIQDILGLEDGTIVASYCHPVGGTVEVRRYDSAGGLIDTYGPFDSTYPGGTNPRLAYAIDSPLSFMLWVAPPTDPGTALFLRIRISDGAILSSAPSTNYEAGIYQPPETATPIDRFGNSESCPFFVIPGFTPACPGEVVGERMDGLPYTPFVGDPCVGSGTVGSPRTGT